MKKLLLMGGVFSIFLSLSIVSCKKEEVKPSNSKTEVSEQNGNVENQKIMIFTNYMTKIDIY